MATHDFRAQESANKGKTYFLLASMGLLTGLVAYAALTYFGAGTSTFLVPLAVGISLIGVWGSFYGSDKLVIKMTGAKVIEREDNPELFNVIEEVVIASGLPMPKVAIVVDSAPNAFATGAFKNSALVAVSTGLLQGMTRDEVEAVLGHEIAHIANGDMVTLTLIQGVLNTFVVFLSRVIGYFVDNLTRSKDDESSGPGWGYYVTSIVLDIVLGFVASMIVAWFSRQREFRADEGSAQLLGQKQPMINALSRLGQMQAGVLPASVSAMGITGDLSKLFASHPPLEERIAALQANK